MMNENNGGYTWYSDDFENQPMPGPEMKMAEEPVAEVKQKKKRNMKSFWKYTAAVVCGIFAGGIIFSAGFFLAGSQQGGTVTRGDSNAPVQYTYSLPDDATMSVVEIAKKAGPAVVGIVNTKQVTSFWGTSTQDNGSGSGIIIRDNGYIITNSHVIEDATEVTVYLSTGEEYPATLVGHDVKTDLAVIKIEATGLPTAEIGKSSELEVGELAVAIGNPLGLEFAGTVTVGYISALNRTMNVEGRQYTLIQTDAAINPGNSGGALVNDKGQVIGINSVKISSTGLEGMGFAIPIDDAMVIINELIEHGYIKGRPVIGIYPREITASMARRYGLVEGIYVVEVSPFSGAEQAGIRAGDVIVKADGKEVKTQQELNDVRDTHKAGETMELEIFRQNEGSLTVKVVLGEETPETVQN